MLIVFRSKAAGEVLMLSEHVGPIFKLIGKELTNSGVFTAAQLPLAIRELETALNFEKNTQKEAAQESDEHHDEPPTVTVALRQRAFPLLDMMKKSAAKQVDVTWNV